MTYGYWLTRTRVHLGDAVEGLESTVPADARDVLAVAGGRNAVYRHLARHVEMLATPRTAARTTPRREMSRVSVIAMFRDRLRAAAEEAMARSPEQPRSAAALSLASAADCLSVAADILAGHLDPLPRTPEGAAIRAGGGAVSAAAELARLGFDAIAVDLAMLTWLDAPDDAVRAIGQPAIAAARRTSGGGLPAVLGKVRALAPHGSSALHDLRAVPAVGRANGEAPVVTVTDAAASLRTASTWLWQNPDRLRTVHLRLGTQVGLAAMNLSSPDGSGRTGELNAWRRATSIATKLSGSAATDDALAAADRLSDVLRWCRDALDHDDPRKINAITDQLPYLAATLLTGTERGIERGDILVRRNELGHVVGGVRRATPVWLRAKPGDLGIANLRDALTAIAQRDAPTARRTARAFQQPPRPGSSEPEPAAVKADGVRRRGRTQ